jgi:hypothetical protein
LERLEITTKQNLASKSSARGVYHESPQKNSDKVHHFPLTFVIPV